MAKRGDQWLDAYGFDYGGLWFRIFVRDGCLLPPRYVSWPRVDRVRESELRKIWGDKLLKDLDTTGVVMVNESVPEKQYFSQRTMLQPKYAEAEILYRDSDGQQFIPIPKEVKLPGKHVIVQYVKDGGLLLRPMPEPFDRDLVRLEAAAHSEHFFHSYVAPWADARVQK